MKKKKRKIDSAKQILRHDMISSLENVNNFTVSN
jgi:hypothetical protein